MFTLKHYSGNEGFYVVYQAKQYSVQYVPSSVGTAGQSIDDAHVVFSEPHAEENDPQRCVIVDGVMDKIYVSNDAGQTVDCIRPRIFRNETVEPARSTKSVASSR